MTARSNCSGNIGNTPPTAALPADATFDSVQFTGGTGTQGTVSWNADEETLDIVQNGAVLQVGQEEYYHVRNNSGVAIVDGDPVGATGTIGASGRLTVAKWDPSTMSARFFLGFATEAIGDDEDGKVTKFGKVRGIQTNGANYSETWNDGDVLYPSPTTTGYVTNVEPEAPDVNLPSAIVINAHASNGTILVRVNNFDRNHPAHQVTLPGKENTGIKLDTTTPTFGWADLIGPIVPSASGATKPTITAFRGSGIECYKFSANDAIDNQVFHIPHDWLPEATELYAHVHWGHNGTAISGNFVIDWYFQYSDGYSDGTFPTPVTITQTIACSIGAHPQYAHNIDEIKIADDVVTAGLLDITGIKVDGLLLCGFKVTGIPTITGGTDAEPFIFTTDLHYQTTSVIGTKNRNTPFYVS